MRVVGGAGVSLTVFYRKARAESTPYRMVMVQFAGAGDGAEV
jgi:hypothetical protein